MDANHYRIEAIRHPGIGFGVNGTGRREVRTTFVVFSRMSGRMEAKADTRAEAEAKVERLERARTAELNRFGMAISPYHLAVGDAAARAERIANKMRLRFGGHDVDGAWGRIVSALNALKTEGVRAGA